jgi:hypothetical protein
MGGRHALSWTDDNPALDELDGINAAASPHPLPYPPHGAQRSRCGIYASAMLVLTCYIRRCPLGGSEELTANLKSVAARSMTQRTKASASAAANRTTPTA